MIQWDEKGHRGFRPGRPLVGWAVAGILGAWLSATARADAAPRIREPFDGGWKFHRGEAKGAEAQGFDDAAWRGVRVPHDWAIEPDAAARGPQGEGSFDPDSPSGPGGGYLPGGVGWYRKTFTPPAEARDRRVFVEFEGVYMQSDVWINGHHLGNRPYGYSTFEYELTPHLRPGDGPNVLAVRVDVPQPSSRWYSGAGIYRHVWLTCTNSVHVEHWGTLVTTPRVADGTAEVRVRTAVRNQAGDTAEVAVRTTAIDPEGRTAWTTETTRRIPGDGRIEIDQTGQIPRPRPWSTEAPDRYTAVTEVVRDGRVVDAVRTPFGIRTFAFTKDRGFLLNGRRVPIKGVCQHHDQGCLGAAAYDRAIERQLEILKAAGCNAIRTSHNPPAPELLDLCDRMGFLVMDEAFDCWNQSKVTYDYGRFFVEWHERDLTDMIRRDRNHPSIILWGIGNEIPNIATAEGAAWARTLAALCRREDPSRPVTAGCNDPRGTVNSGAADALDVFGINYHLEDFDIYRDWYPLVSSESASTTGSRGEYNLRRRDGEVGIVPARGHQASAYDVYVTPWANQAEHMLWKLEQSPWIAGEFVWTGFDYIGEPTPFDWPSVLSYFGFIDLCGFPKDRFYLYQSRWTDRPMVHILPHWNWEGWSGAKIPVWCYSNADEVELFLDGESLGIKSLEDTPQPRLFPDPAARTVYGNRYVEAGGHSPQPLHFAWDVPWRPGVLKAEARRGGRVVATDEVRTAGAPAQLVLEVDRPQLRAGGQDLAFVTVKVTDRRGVVCPAADDLVRFELSGPADLVGVGNGDPISHEDFQADRRSAWHGLALAVIRAGDGPGTVRLRARAEGLDAAEVTIRVR
jgi:beta-galactosidase